MCFLRRAPSGVYYLTSMLNLLCQTPIFVYCRPSVITSIHIALPFASPECTVLSYWLDPNTGVPIRPSSLGGGQLLIDQRQKPA